MKLLTFLLDVAKIIQYSLPFILLCYINFKINLNKANRSRQFAMPFITILYSTLAVMFLDKINGWVILGFDFLCKYIPILEKIKLQSYLIYILNALLVVGYLIVKGACLPILNKIWGSSNKITQYTAGYFYDFKEDLGKWLFKRKFANLRGFLKGIYVAYFIAALIVFICSQKYRTAILFVAPMYPVFGVLVLGEFVTFLSGITKPEFVEDILGEDEESYKMSNYAALRGVLSDLFPDRVLYENTLDNDLGIGFTFDALDEMENSDDEQAKFLGQYFKALKQNGKDIDINYVKSCANLLNGASTLFSSPFYRDLTDYIMLPAVKQLISYKKCLVIVGRDSACEDVKAWLDESLLEFTNTNSLWKTKVLDESYDEVDIGIVKQCDIYNLKIHRVNKDFLSKVGLVVLIEPSKILGSGQLGLNLLVNACETEEKQIVYCACDRNCDGLVDALSHTLKTSITQVMATTASGSNSSHMYWNAEGEYMHHKILPNISRYLGIGTEINSVAIKHQIPNTVWVGSEKFPVCDMKWIAGQYYKQLCDYTDIPISQESFNRAFTVNSNLWNIGKRDNAFIVVEDEFQNLFEMTRVFASRAKKQGFINVVSENYLLRDYMIDNVQTFLSDPKAIPTIVPDYARTERNMVLKLIMLMANAPLDEEDIKKELMICGISFTDPYLKLKELIIKHCNVEDASLTVRFREELSDDSLNSTIVKQFAIDETNELHEYSSQLKNAYFIAEDEIGEKYYIGAKLYGHVFQAFLPGQFMTFDGKYYEIQTITPLNGVVVRRASDHITKRRYYRSLQSVSIRNFNLSSEMGTVKTYSDIEIANGYADICVSTQGYLEMEKYGDIKNSHKVIVNNIPDRTFRQKNLLRIKLPSSTENTRYTICLLLNEIFKTVYPEGCAYIKACTSVESNLETNIDDLIYKLTFEGQEEQDCIYIIEDSELDLGLLVSFERNFKRFFEIICEVLVWHTNKMLEKPKAQEPEVEYVPKFDNPPKEPGFFEKVVGFFKGLFTKKETNAENPDGTETEQGDETSETQIEPETQFVDGENVDLDSQEQEEALDGQEEEIQGEDFLPKKRGFFGKIIDFFKRLFTKKEADEENPEEQEIDTVSQGDQEDDSIDDSADQTESIADTQESNDENESEENSMALRTSTPETNDIESVVEPVDDVQDALEPSEIDIQAEDEEIESLIENCETEYQKNCFLKFGFEGISEKLSVDETVEYLKRYSFDNNPLQQVRNGQALAEEYAKTYDPQKHGGHICDFCGCEIVGGEYEVLHDGRERCNHCSMTAVRTGEDFKEIFKNVMNNMEAFFGIKINLAIKVRMTNAKKIAKHFNEKFVATDGFDARTLGFAKKDKDGYSIYIENGSPKLSAISTLVHELTHIWQYQNWNDKELQEHYGKENMLEVYEGMAKWAEIQYLILLNEIKYAKRQEICTRLREDEYGKGFIKYCEKYPLSYNTTVSRTPFKDDIPL